MQQHSRSLLGASSHRVPTTPREVSDGRARPPQDLESSWAKQPCSGLAAFYPSPPMSRSPPAPRPSGPPFGDHLPALRRGTLGEGLREGPTRTAGPGDEGPRAGRSWRPSAGALGGPTQAPSISTSGLSTTGAGPAFAFGDAGQATQQYLSPTSPTVRTSPFVQPSPPSASRMARRAKAHVPSACVNCKKAHLGCDVDRPCPRCVSTGKQDSCKDVQHKKRGRPRLRDEREALFGPREAGASLQDHQPRPPLLLSASPTSNPPHAPRSAPNRVLKAQSGGSSGHRASHLGHASLADANVVQAPLSGPVGSFHRTKRPGHALDDVDVALLYLHMNFAVAKANPALHAVFGTRDVDIRGRDVLELCDLSERDKLGKLRRELEEERNIRDPAYLPPIYSDSSELRAIEEVGDGSVGDVTHGSKDRPADIRFMIHGQPQLLPAQFNLAKTSVYFVVMVLSRYSPLQPQNVPPLFAQQGYGSTPPSMMMPSRGHITANRFISRGSSDPTFSRSFQGGALPGGASRGRSPPGAGQLAVDHVVGEQYQHHRTSPSVSSAPSYHSTQSPPGSEAAMLRRADLSHEGQNPGYPRDLQLAPMRGSAGTSPVETYPSSRESLGRTGESTGRTRRKRERVSVEEMLE